MALAPSFPVLRPDLSADIFDSHSWNKKKIRKYSFTNMTTIDFPRKGDFKLKGQKKSQATRGANDNQGRFGAADILGLMDTLNIWADSKTYSSLLQECAHMNALTEGIKVHAHMTKTGFQPDLFVKNNLVSMYVKCGDMASARQVFDKMRDRDKVSWTAMIAGYAENGMAEEALKLFYRMRRARMKANQFTFVGILTACASLEALEPGKQAHAWIVKKGFMANMYLGSTLVDLYANCEELVAARHVFDEMYERDVVSWTAMIAGYSQQRYRKQVLALFNQMRRVGVNPNGFTFPTVLRTYAGLGNINQGKGVHAYAIKIGVETNVFVGSALVDMYSKCGSLADARQVFNEMPERDTVSWNVMIAGYLQYGCCEQAQLLVRQMQLAGMELDEFIVVGIRKACGSEQLNNMGT
eukprot:Gb_41454 [translate_table: standard]